MKDRNGIMLLHETKIALKINPTTLSDLHLYIYNIYTSNEKLYYDIYLRNKDINYTRNIRFVLRKVENHTRNVANKCCTYIRVGINYGVT